MGQKPDHPDCPFIPLLAAIDMDWVEGMQNSMLWRERGKLYNGADCAWSILTYKQHLH